MKTSFSDHKEGRLSDKVLNVIENENIIGSKLGSSFTDHSAFGVMQSFNLAKSLQDGKNTEENSLKVTKGKIKVVRERELEEESSKAPPACKVIKFQFG